MDIKKALHTLQTMIPIEVFKQFCQVLSCINAPISDMLITSILSICTKKEKGVHPVLRILLLTLNLNTMKNTVQRYGFLTEQQIFRVQKGVL